MASDYVVVLPTDAKPDLSLQCQAWQHANLTSVPAVRCICCKPQIHKLKAVTDARPNSSKGYTFEVTMNIEH